MQSLRIKSEYAVHGNVLICWKETYKPLIYKSIITSILDHQSNIKIFVVCKNAAIVASVKEYLEIYSINLEEIRFIVFEFQSIWIRDFTPIPMLNDKMETKALVKFHYNKTESRPLNTAFAKIMADQLGLPISSDLPVKIVGGNILTDGHSSIVCTKQVIEENNYSYHQLQSLFRKHFGLDNLIYWNYQSLNIQVILIC